METIYITYKNNKLEKMCNDIKESKKQLGEKAGKSLALRIVQLKAFENLQMVPSSLPWRREKLKGYENRWSIRIDGNFRIEFKALDLNMDLRMIEKIEILEVSKHYG